MNNRTPITQYETAQLVVSFTLLFLIAVLIGWVIAPILPFIAIALGIILGVCSLCWLAVKLASYPVEFLLSRTYKQVFAGYLSIVAALAIILTIIL